MAFFGVFDKIGETIQDGLQAGFENINPMTNDMVNTLYGINMNPFDLPNSFIDILTALSLGFVLIFGITHLFKNINIYSQRVMAKKALLVIVGLIATLGIGSLFRTDVQTVTFNLSLIYKKSTASAGSSSSQKVTLDSLGYKSIAATNPFGENPYAYDKESQKVAGQTDQRTNIEFNVYNSLEIHSSPKYQQDFSLAVGVNPLLGQYGELVEKGTYIAQHDIINATKNASVDAGLDICPGEGSGSSMGTSTFSDMLSSEDGTRQETFKKIGSTGENGFGYKPIKCVNSKGYRKDIIFLNEGTVSGGEGDKVSSMVYSIVPFYYPLDILNGYSIHNGSDDGKVGDDFIMRPSIAGTGSVAVSEVDKARNQQYIDFKKKLNSIGLTSDMFDDVDGAGKDNIQGFNFDKISIINAYNKVSSKGNTYDANPYIDNVLSLLGNVYSIVDIGAQQELRIQQMEAGLDVSNTGSLDSLNKEKEKLEIVKTRALEQYALIISNDSNKLIIFNMGEPPLSPQEFQNATFSKIKSSISYAQDFIKNERAAFYGKSETELIAIMNDLIKYQNEDKTNTVKIINDNISDVYTILKTFFSSESVLGKNLQDSESYILERICGTDEKLKSINSKLQLIGSPQITAQVIDCKAGVKGTIVDKNALIEIFNRAVAWQYKKDASEDVNLMTYYGKIIKDSTTNNSFASLTTVKYSNSDKSIYPVKIGNYTLISPLYYYYKLLNSDFAGLPIFINLEAINGKVYMPDKVYDMKIGSPASWYKDLDGINGEKYSNYFSLGIPTLGNIFMMILFLFNCTLLGGAYLYIITIYTTLLKSN